MTRHKPISIASSGGLSLDENGPADHLPVANGLCAETGAACRASVTFERKGAR